MHVINVILKNCKTGFHVLLRRIVLFGKIRLFTHESDWDCFVIDVLSLYGDLVNRDLVNISKQSQESLNYLYFANTNMCTNVDLIISNVIKQKNDFLLVFEGIDEEDFFSHRRTANWIYVPADVFMLPSLFFQKQTDPEAVKRLILVRGKKPLKRFQSCWSELINIEVLKMIRIAKTGFFSDCSILLQNIVDRFNQTTVFPKKLVVSTFSQYQVGVPKKDSHSLFFQNLYNRSLISPTPLKFSNGYQYRNYQEIDFRGLRSVIKAYFTPLPVVEELEKRLSDQYRLNVNQLISVYYRGNDKAGETEIASHEEFIEKTKEVLSGYPDYQILVQTDELEFREKFVSVFPKAIVIEEMPVIPSKTTPGHTVLNSLEPKVRIDFAYIHLAVTRIMAKSKIVITHSGNCGLWVLLYRGNSDGVFQYLKKTGQGQAGKWYS